MSNELQQLQQEQALLQQLRASDDPASLQQADQLRKLYHDRQMDALSQDVYAAAKGEGHPPLGWIRLSEHPELIDHYAQMLHVSKAELALSLHPDVSGFRAEVYLPDPKVLGPGFKPTLTFKGSSGNVKTSDGKLHDTTMEDFLANNFPQSVGLETDYYDRAMSLAHDLKRGGMDFEATGHSLAGGMASAASAVTGVTATTFNAAGLSPETAKRFCDQNNLPLYDVDHRITAYQVKGELLTDGVQGNIHGMDTIERAQFATVLKETSDLLTRVPGFRNAVEQQMDSAQLPPQARQSVHEFLDRVAHGDTNQMLRDLPLAAGQVHLLDPMTRDAHGQLVPRDPTMGLPALTAKLAPVLQVLDTTATGARVGDKLGHSWGDAVAQVGRSSNAVLHATGSDVRQAAEGTGEALRTKTHVDGEVQRQAVHVAMAAAAHARTVGAELGAQWDQGVGHARDWGASLDSAALRGLGHVVPDSAQSWLNAKADVLDRAGQHALEHGQSQAAADRRAGEVDAAALRREGLAAEHAATRFATDYANQQHDAVTAVGQGIGRSLDAIGQTELRMTDYAPGVGAGMGAVAAGLAATSAEIPSDIRVGSAVGAMRQANAVGVEAFNRHLMASSVTPSMDNLIQQQERAATEPMQRSAAPVQRQREVQASASHAVPDTDQRTHTDPQHIHRAFSAEPAKRGDRENDPAERTGHEQTKAGPQSDLSKRLDRMLKAAEAGDWASFRKDTQAFADMAPGRQLHAHAVAMVNQQERHAAQLAAQQKAMEQQQAMQQQATHPSRGFSR